MKDILLNLVKNPKILGMLIGLVIAALSGFIGVAPDAIKKGLCDGYYISAEEMKHDSFEVPEQ